MLFVAVTLHQKTFQRARLSLFEWGVDSVGGKCGLQSRVEKLWQSWGKMLGENVAYSPGKKNYGTGEREAIFELHALQSAIHSGNMDKDWLE